MSDFEYPSEEDTVSQEPGLEEGPAEDDGGGPVKTFLEHLEDLRWMLIKCVSAVVICMIVCLMASNYLVSFLTWPLRSSQYLEGTKNVGIYLEDQRLAFFPETVATNLIPWELESASRVNLRFRTIGTNVVMVAELESSNLDPAAKTAVALKNYSPIGAFMVAFQLMLYGGLVVSAPLVIFFVGQFVLPALHVHEKRFLYQTAGFGAGLFILGIAFCYFVVMPIALLATVSFSQWMGFAADEWRAEDYISFVCKLMLVMGLSFQLPVILLTMVKAGVLDYGKLIKFRPYWVIINLFICAVVTPTADPFTLLMIAVPLQFLYELSVFISRFWEKQEEAVEE